jgi:RimJ/RimL family protein N-acetyltransferase
METLKTERLILRMFREDDLDAYAAICAQPEVMRFLGNGVPLDRADSWRQMAFFIGHWHLRGYGQWAVEERDTGTLVGRIGFYNPEGWPGFELGWVLGKEHWGQGYATEGASRCLDHAFDEMGREHVISLIHPDNRASIRVADRLGEKRQGTAHVNEKDVLVFGISKETWRERQGR